MGTEGGTSGKEIYSVDLGNNGRGGGQIGTAADSVVTNSAHLADVIKKSNCKTCGDVEDAIDKEMTRQHWNAGQVQFEQHIVKKTQ